MLKRWSLYLAAWAGCLLFFIFYRQWFSWLVLVAVTATPALSVLLSLPAMLTARVHVAIPPAVTLGTPAPIAICLKSPLPLPRWTLRIRVERLLTGQYWVLKPEYLLPTEHCGQLECFLSRGYIYDYLGLVRLSLRYPKTITVKVRPRLATPPDVMPPGANRAISWKPKPGGGFSENYELRLYRPGDSIQHIHWKLSGKTGKLILREPLEPAVPPTLALSLRGVPEVLDRKLGQLLYLGMQYLQASIGFQILAHTGSGPRRYSVSTEVDLQNAIDDLLAQSPADSEPILPALQRCQYIGGDSL